jgi:RNA polymerase sigma-70 factor (ECF subfamily)
VQPTDQEAWCEFVDRYGRKIFGWCRQWGLQEADARDVTQNVLAELARQMQRFRYDPAGRFRSWLKTLTHRAWCDFLGARRRVVAGSGDSAVLQLIDSVPAQDDLAAILEDEFDLELLERAMEQVRRRVQPHTWEAFRLMAIESLSGDEAAMRLGMKVGAVYVARSKVQKMIRQALELLDPRT